MSRDVVIVGAGLAGLTLARHLLLDTDCRVVMLERRPRVPAERQKVGESTVQLAGYYLSKVLDMEEHLLTRHFLKYNLRFYWPSGGRSNAGFEDYSQSYIRELSNVASYQLDRNAFEAELLRLNQDDERFTFVPGARRLQIDLAESGRHRISYRSSGDGAGRTLTADWVIDATGRVGLLARRRQLRRPSSIRHGAFFWWVDGLIDVEKLTTRSRSEVRLDRRRSRLGHLPSFLATNHFMGEGFWFWVIPLHGKTSLGLVYDRDLVGQEEVFSVEKATRWVCERFPLLARDLPHRRVLDWSGLKSFSHDCAQTIHPSRWAITGEAGRFSDPLYSPGSDLISLHNTLIVDAIKSDDPAEPERLTRKCAGYEPMMRAFFEAYEPSYALSYDALGDPEVFNLKYAWELSVYFGFYVFPFINDLFTERRFQPAFVRAFARLGPINRGVQRLLSGYFQWKKERGLVGSEAPIDFDFTCIVPLDRARETFYEVGRTPSEGRHVLSGQLENLEELARFVAASVAAGALGEPGALTNRRFVEGFDLAALDFDPAVLRRRYDACAAAEPEDATPWSFEAPLLAPYRERSGEAPPHALRTSLPPTPPAAGAASGEAAP